MEVGVNVVKENFERGVYSKRWLIYIWRGVELSTLLPTEKFTFNVFNVS